MKKLFCVFMLVIILLMPLAVRATVGPLVQEAVVFLDDEIFTIWGVGDDVAVSFVRLRDLAYILNGTPAQFNFAESHEENISYRIFRGEPYIPQGNELLPIEYYHEEGGPRWFAAGGMYNVKIGVDGGNSPETVILFNVYGDGYDYFFPLGRMGTLLGYSLEWSRVGYWMHSLYDFYVEGATYVISTVGREPAVLPVQTAEFLQLMERLAGHWVDDTHFYGEVIDESVVFPRELFIFLEGYGVTFESWDSVAPIHRAAVTPWWARYRVAKRSLGDGLLELMLADTAESPWHFTPDDADEFPNLPYLTERRIILDPAQEEIAEIFFFDSGEKIRMVRAYHSRDLAPRYTLEMNTDGHIVIRYVLGQGALRWGRTLMISRAVRRDYLGELLLYQEDFYPDDRAVFEFTDTTAQRGHTYYYLVRRSWVSEWVRELPEPDFIIRADVDALYAEFISVQELLAIEAETQTRNRLFIAVFAIVVMSFLIIGLKNWGAVC
ncbi:MAG: hypothetical protein FWB96_10670 [Defluviitaleaceae bacterium]|nr:hypothetical protein [Defluviitaleaceae bacterium]MCL2263351.1 hypothetical protein [Defluviitaleaceae bacterium]